MKMKVCAVAWDWPPFEERQRLIQKEKVPYDQVIVNRVRLCLYCGHEVTVDHMKGQRIDGSNRYLKLSDFPAKAECPWCDRPVREEENENEHSSE